MKTIRLRLALAIPLLALAYNVGAYLQWWDQVFGRKLALAGWSRILDSTGLDRSVWVCDDDEEYSSLLKFINRSTRNPEVLLRLKMGAKPKCIQRFNVQSLRQSLPPDWPNQTFVPESAIVAYLFGGGRKDGQIYLPESKDILWVGTMGDIRRWIEQDRERERFLVSQFFIVLLSLVVAYLAIGEARANN